jgi:hypothetical protein
MVASRRSIDNVRRRCAGPRYSNAQRIVAPRAIATTGNGNNQQLLVAKRQDGDGSKTIALLDNHPRNCTGFMEQ